MSMAARIDSLLHHRPCRLLSRQPGRGRIVSARVKRMTASDPPHRQPRARARTRAPSAPAARTPSSSARSGTPPAAAVGSRADSRAITSPMQPGQRGLDSDYVPLRSSPAAASPSSHRGDEAGERRAVQGRRASRRRPLKYHLDLPRATSVRLAEPPARAVSLDRSPDLPAHREPRLPRPRRGAPQRNERRPLHPLASLEHRLESPARSALAQPHRRVHRVPHGR